MRGIAMVNSNFSMSVSLERKKKTQFAHIFTLVFTWRVLLKITPWAEIFLEGKMK